MKSTCSLICKLSLQLGETAVTNGRSWSASEPLPWPPDTQGTRLMMALGSRIYARLRCTIWRFRRQTFVYARRHTPPVHAKVVLRRRQCPTACAAPNWPSWTDCRTGIVNSNGSSVAFLSSVLSIIEQQVLCHSFVKSRYRVSSAP